MRRSREILTANAAAIDMHTSTGITASGVLDDGLLVPAPHRRGLDLRGRLLALGDAMWDRVLLVAGSADSSSATHRLRNLTQP